VKWIEYWLARILLARLNWLPERFAEHRVWLYAHLLDSLVPRLRRIAIRNLTLAGLNHPDRITDGVFRSLARLIVTFGRFPSLTRENIGNYIRYEGIGNFTSAHARGKGVLIATGHLGNWELSAFAHAWMTAPMHIVVRPLDNARLDELVEQRRALSGNHIIRKKEAAREILRALAAGDAVGILIDQNTGLSEGVFIDFFGVKACAGTAFVKFAHHTGAAVVPGFAVWSDSEKKYVLHFYPEVPMSGDVQEDTQRVHSVLERVIREYPDQWLWIHRRWKTRPPGEPPVY
jgi:Kdo2-lipid IVA lauroyltransferase/acyltransferase